MNGIGILGFTLTEDTVIEGDVYLIADTLDLNGYELKISGNLYLGGGILNINGGSLDVSGALRIQALTFNDDNSISTYEGSQAVLQMTNETDKVTVGKEFVMSSNKNHEGYLTDGILEVKGNFYQYSTNSYNFRATGNHKVVLSGDKKQNIHFDNPSYSYFSNLEIANTSEAGVIRDTAVYVNGKLKDINQKLTESNWIYIKGINSIEGTTCGGSVYLSNASTLTTDLDIRGDMQAYANLDLNGFTINARNMWVSSGTTYINGGRLNLSGNMTVQEYSYLKMTNPEDNISVSGNFTMSSRYSHSGYLTAGTLELRGDFTQNSYNSYNFLATGEHKTILTGKAGTANRNYIQVVRFDSAGSSKFNHLVLCKAKSLYSFTPNLASVCNDYISEAKDDESPEQVTGLQASKVETTKITLSWDATTDNEGVVGYEVYRGNVKVGTTSGTSFIDSGLAPNTTYIYKVCAFDEMRNISVDSDGISATTLEDTEAPTVPAGLKVKTKTGSAITIAWSASSDDVGVKGYIVYKNGEEIARFEDVTSYRDTDVELDELYSYQIKAYDDAGNESELSSEIKGSIAMPEITRFEPTNNTSIGGGTVTLTTYYKNVGNSTGNKVKYEYLTKNDEGEEVWEQIGGVLYGQQTYNSSTFYSRCTWNYSNVENGECKMRITLYDADGNTDIETFSYIIDTEGPEPSDTIWAKSLNGVVSVAWAESNSADCVKYKVFRSESENGTYTYLTTVNTNEYTDTAVETGKTYYYKVSGIDNFAQEGELSECASVKVTDDEEPPTVDDISVKNKTINGTSVITVTAKDNVKVNTITLEYKDAETDKWIVIDEADKAATNNKAQFIFDTTVLKDGTYELRAVAKDMAGNSSAGTYIVDDLEFVYDPYYANVTVDNTGIEKIVVTEATGYATYVTLKWNDVPEDDFSYFIVEQLKDGRYETVQKVTTTLGAHIQGLAIDTEYTFRVVGYDMLGNRGIPSENVVVSTVSDKQAPIVKSFGPATKYYAQYIPLSISVTDNVGVKSLKLTYSTDGEVWNDIDTITLDTAKLSETFDYKFDVSNIREGKVFVRVYAYDVAGNESNSNGEPIENNFIIDRTAPSKVTNVKAEGYSGYNSITWNKAPESDNVKEFRLYRALEEVGNFSLLRSGITTNVYYDTNVTAGTVYIYKVVAVDQAGNVSEYSTEVVAQSRQDDEAPKIHGVSPVKDSKITGNVKIEAAVSDNSSIKEVIFEYKEKDSNEDIWTELGTVAVGASTGYPSVTWDVSKYDNKEYEIRITAEDYNNNISDIYKVTYTVDTKAPKAPVITGKGLGYSAELTWEANTEEDFAYYEIYRKLGSDEEYSVITKTKKNTYKDSELKGGRKYEYKIYAYDSIGNYSVSEVCTLTTTTEDKIKPLAVASENLSVRVGSEVLLDGTASSDNVKIVSYKWDMGNGDTVYGPVARYRYNEMGTYEAKLTVTDSSGNTDTTDIVIRVRSRISAKVNVKVVNEKNGNNFSMSYAYVYIETDGVGTNYRADAYGEVSVVLDAGTHIIDVYKEGYMPKSYTINVANGDEQSYVFAIEKGELVTGELKTTRLTLEQILDLGVDIQDPNNWYTHEYILKYTDPERPAIKEYVVPLQSGKVVKVEDKDLSGSGINVSGSWAYYIGLTEVEGKKVVTIYRTVSYLKKMYDVELLITNNAEDGFGFDIVNSTAELNLPEGLSLLKLSTPQNLVNDMGTVHAQETKETHWYIKADEPGMYDLSATFNGTLMPFEAPVETVISADEPLVVTEQEDNTFTDEGFVTNPTDYVINVTNKNGERIKGAIVTIQYDGKQCQTITNSRGRALLEVNKDDKRTFKLIVQHDDYVLHEQIYEINEKYYDKIVLYKEGETREEDMVDGKPSNPYSNYAIPIESAKLGCFSILNKEQYINMFNILENTLTIKFEQKIISYELSSNDSIIKKGNVNSDELQIKFSGTEISKAGQLFLVVYGKKKNDETNKTETIKVTYPLNVWAENKLYDEVIINYQKSTADVLKECFNIFISDSNNKVNITCNTVLGAGSYVEKYVLVQEDEVIETSRFGEFELREWDFDKYERIYLIAYNKDDKEVSREELQISVLSRPNIPEDLTFSMSNTSGGCVIKVSFDDNTPLLGGQTFAFNLDKIKLPYEVTYTNDKCKVSFKQPKDTVLMKFGTDKNGGKVTLGMAGELEANYDSTKFKGSMKITLKAKGNFEKQIPSTPLVVEVGLTGELTATGELVLNLDEKAEEIFSGALKSVLKMGIEICVGLGIEKIAKVCVYGNGYISFEYIFLPLEDAGPSKVWVDGEFGAKYTLLWFEHKVSILKCKNVILYEKEKKVNDKSSSGMSMGQVQSELLNMDNYSLLSLTRSSTRTEWLGLNITESTNTIQMLQGSAYDMMTPQLVTAGNTTLLIYEDEDTNATIANRSRIKYSVYENGKFTTPVCVGDTGHGQCGVDVYSDGDNIYIVWQEAKEILRDDVTLLDTAKSIELKAAKYDAATGKFISLGTITNNEMYESQPQISADENGIYVVWSENSENNVFGEGGTNKIYKATYADSEWSNAVVAEGLASIASMDAGKLSDGMYVSYSENGTGKLVNLDTNVSASLLDAVNVQFGYVAGQGAIIWHNGEKLMYAEEAGVSGNVLFDKSGVASNSYKYVSDASGNGTVVYSYTYEGKAQVYMADYDSSTKEWGNIQAITNQNEYLEKITGTYRNGQLVLAFNKTRATVTADTVETESDLCCMKIGKETNILLNGVNYDLAEVIPGGNVTISLDIANKGLRTVKAEDITITITDENGKVKAQAKGTKSILAGTNETQEIVLNLPYALAALDYNINVSCDGISIDEVVTLGYADLTIDSKVCVDHGVYEVRAIVGNQGIEAASGKVVFYNQDDENQILGEKTFDDIFYGETKELVCKLDKDIYDGSKSLTVGMRIVTEETQSNTENDVTGIYLAGRKASNPQLVIFDYDMEGYEKVRKYAEEGTGVKFPEAPVKKGYTFLGWYNGDVKYTESTPVTENITLVAKYEKIKEDKKPSEDNVPKLNSTATVNGVVYKVTKSSKTDGTVAVLKLSNNKTTSVVIPMTVKINGYTFKVTEISQNAFKNATKLKNITVQSTEIKKVGKDAFKNIHKKAVINVPAGKLKAYKTLFKNKGQAKSVKIEAILPGKNTKKTIKGITYKITKSSKTKGTVSVYKLSKKTAKTVTIPESVKIDGYTFKVTVIEKSAFASAKKLSKVVIGKNVTMIGKNAFKDCKNLKTIQVKSTVLKSVGANALKNINAKAKIKVPAAKKKVYTKLFKNKGQKKTVKITK